VTHVLPLSQAPHAYKIFDQKAEGCVKVVFKPQMPPAGEPAGAGDVAEEGELSAGLTAEGEGSRLDEAILAGLAP